MQICKSKVVQLETEVNGLYVVFMSTDGMEDTCCIPNKKAS